jgi:hypothetical protein
MAERENIAGTAYIPYNDANRWSRLAKAVSQREGARVKIGNVVFDFTKDDWNTVVKNLGAVFGAQPAKAYAAAVKQDLIKYLEHLAPGLQKDENVAPLVQKVGEFLYANDSRVGSIIADAIKQPTEFFSTFLKLLREYAEIRKANSVVDALKNRDVRQILRSALIASVVRYLATVHRAVEVNGQPIGEPELKRGIIGLVLANLDLISD